MNQFSEKIRASKFFYRDHYRKAVASLLLFLMIIVGLLLGIAYNIIMRQEPAYYATSVVGDLFPLHSVLVKQSSTPS